MANKRYVCTYCGYEHLALPYGGHCDKCRRTNLRAAYVCPNCGQWQWSNQTEVEGVRKLYYECLNQCASKGLAESIVLTI